MMIQQLKIEEYNHSHQNGVNSLFEYVYDKKVIPEFFTWRYYYFGKPLRYVMINDDNSIIAPPIEDMSPLLKMETMENDFLIETSEISKKIKR